MENKINVKVDNFEAVIASGNVRLIGQNDEVKLYIDDEGVEYIYDGSAAHSQFSDDFPKLKAQYFGESTTGV